MLSVTNSSTVGGRVLSPVSSGVFAHLRSTRRLGIFHGRLFRDVVGMIFLTYIEFLVEAATTCGNVADKVIGKLSFIIAPDKNSHYRKIARSVVTVFTLGLGILIFLEGVLALFEFTATLLALAVILFVVHNIVSTAIAGAINLSKEILDLFKKLYANPAQHIAEGKKGFEFVMEMMLYRISAFVIGAIYITPSLLSVVGAIVLNPFYMLWNTLVPWHARAEDKELIDRAAAQVAEALEFSSSKIDEAVESLRSSPNMCFQSSDATQVEKAVDASKELFDLMRGTSENISKKFSQAMKVIDTAIEESLDEATADVLREAKGVLDAHKVEISNPEHIRSSLSKKLEAEHGKRSESVMQENTAIRLLNIFKSLKEPQLDSTLCLLRFTSAIRSKYAALQPKATETPSNARVFGRYVGLNTWVSDASVQSCFGQGTEVACCA